VAFRPFSIPKQGPRWPCYGEAAEDDDAIITTQGAAVGLGFVQLILLTPEEAGETYVEEPLGAPLPSGLSGTSKSIPSLESESIVTLAHSLATFWLPLAISVAAVIALGPYLYRRCHHPSGRNPVICSADGRWLIRMEGRASGWCVLAVRQ
jgi:hypothetical protein